MKLTEKHVQNSLFGYRLAQGHKLMVTNCEALGYDADFISVRPTGFLIEHEIKLTRADYLNEFASRTKKAKHARLRRAFDGDSYSVRVSPNYFYFVVPKGLLRSSDPCPKYAGIIEFELLTHETVTGVKRYQISFSDRRVARQIHNTKISDHTRAKIATSLMHRFFRQRIALDKEFFHA